MGTDLVFDTKPIRVTASEKPLRITALGRHLAVTGARFVTAFFRIYFKSVVSQR